MKKWADDANLGVVVSVRGSVVDVRFNQQLPPIHSLLYAGDDGEIVPPACCGVPIDQKFGDASVRRAVGYPGDQLDQNILLPFGPHLDALDQ